MKLKKINLSALSNAELNEREMCSLMGGGIPGCCQCGCNAANSGGSSTSANDTANDSSGYTSDPGATTPCDEEGEDSGSTNPPFPMQNSGKECGYYEAERDGTVVAQSQTWCPG